MPLEHFVGVRIPKGQFNEGVIMKEAIAIILDKDDLIYPSLRTGSWDFKQNILNRIRKSDLALFIDRETGKTKILKNRYGQLITSE